MVLPDGKPSADSAEPDDSELVTALSLPGIPEPKIPLDKLSRRQFECAIRRAQGFAAKETAAEFGVNPKTITAHLERARLRMNLRSVQDLIALVYKIYAPNLWIEADNETGR